MDECLGKEYVLVESKNFEDYLYFLGYGYMACKAAMALHPVQCLIRNSDGTYTFTFKSRLTNGACTFVPGEEFEETKPGGVKVRSVITIDDNKMIHTQTEQNGKISTHVREFHPEEMIVGFTLESWIGYAIETSLRQYTLQKNRCYFYSIKDTTPKLIMEICNKLNYILLFGYDYGELPRFKPPKLTKS